MRGLLPLRRAIVLEKFYGTEKKIQLKMTNNISNKTFAMQSTKAGQQEACKKQSRYSRYYISSFILKR